MAYEELQNRFGSIAKAYEAVTSLNVSDLISVLEILARNGELSRRYLGYSETKIHTKEELLVALQPSDIPGIRDAVTSALIDGTSESKEETVDLGLIRLNKEKKQDLTVIYKAALQLGMSMKEIMLMPLGDIYDILTAGDKDGN